MTTLTERAPGKHTGRRTHRARPILTPEERARRMTEARERLEAAVDRLKTADGWRAMIEARRRLRRYSLRNLLMIVSQRPDATDVRALREWNRAGRKVRKGERAVRIWAPSVRRADPVADPAEETSAPEPGGTSARGEAEPRRVVRFVLVSVFDVSQTEGESLPQPVAPALLTGTEPGGMWDAVAEQVTARGYSVERGDCDDANGWTRYDTRTVRVRADVEPAQAVKTLIHELAHIACDHEHRAESRALCEIEAESVACVVADACGLDTLAYSVPYVAIWSDTGREEITATAEQVLAVADTILSGIGIESACTSA